MTTATPRLQDDEIKELVFLGKTIIAIKEYRLSHNVSLKEAHTWVMAVKEAGR